MTDVKVRDLRQKLRVASRGKGIAEIGPRAASKEASRAARARLKGSVLRWDDPLAPAAGPEDWEANH